MLIFVGLGLTIDDLTAGGREAVEGADEVLAEFYTSRLVGKKPKEMATWLGRPIRFLTRKQVEEEAEVILDSATKGTVAFLTAGDPLTATTHNALRFRARRMGIKVQVRHGVSIQTAAAGEVGLHSYKFGRTTTLAFPHGTYVPESPYEVVAANLRRGLHSLILLDIQAEEDKFMRVDEAARQLLKVDASRPESVLNARTRAVGVARVGSPDQRIVAAPLGELRRLDMGKPPHCVIVPGNLHFTEEEALAQWTR